MLLSTGGSLTIFATSNVVASGVDFEGGTLYGAGQIAAPVIGTLGGTVNVPNGTDLMTLSGSVAVSGPLTKTGSGTLLISNSGSHVHGNIVLGNGAFRPPPAVLAASGNVLVSGSGGYPTLDGSGTFSESSGTGGGQVQWAGNGGFAAKGGR